MKRILNKIFGTPKGLIVWFAVLFLILSALLIGGVNFSKAQTGREYIRVRVDLAIPLATWRGWTQAQRDAVKDKLLQIKAFGVKINTGKPSEENTVTVKWHICRHELGLPCDAEKDF
jgi:hypothetical protein